MRQACILFRIIRAVSERLQPCPHAKLDRCPEDSWNRCSAHRWSSCPIRLRNERLSRIRRP